MPPQVSERGPMRLRSAITGVLLLGTSLSAAPMRAAAQGFEGVITLKESRTEDDSARLQTFMIKGGALRIERIGSDEGPSAVIFDPKGASINMLMVKQKMYVHSPIDPEKIADREAKKDVTIEKTGRTETVAGYRCEHWIVTDKSDSDKKPDDICVTKELGGFPFFQMPMARGAPSWVNQVKDVFPLKVTKVGSKTPQLEVVKVERKSLDAALFLPPPDFKKVDAGTMGRQMMQKPAKP